MMLKLTRFPERAEDAYKREEGRAGWLEVYGETEPTAISVAEAPPAKGADHLYEYIWSLGYFGATIVASSARQEVPEGRTCRRRPTVF
jgi:hypothetical protein